MHTAFKRDFTKRFSKAIFIFISRLIRAALIMLLMKLTLDDARKTHA